MMLLIDEIGTSGSTADPEATAPHRNQNPAWIFQHSPGFDHACVLFSPHHYVYLNCSFYTHSLCGFAIFPVCSIETFSRLLSWS